jgi:AcrR family transcriptional regulator
LFRFATHGYHATTLRLLAEDLGVTPAAFYYHFKSKDELLTALIEDIVMGDLELLRRIEHESHGDPLDTLIYAHVYGMCHGREEALVVAREARFLGQGFRKRVARIVRQYEAIFEKSIAEQYELSGEDLTLATRAVIGLGESVVQWFDKSGRLDEHDVALRFTRYARGILDATTQESKRKAPRAARNGDEPFRNAALMIRDRVALRRRSAAVAQA